MYSYEWDSSTGGMLLNSTQLKLSKEPRPVYYRELDVLGFDKYWNYEKNDDFPYMWAETNNYWYRGKLVAKTKGGSLYTVPELVLLEKPEPEGEYLRFIDIPAMVEKNRDILEGLVQETIKKIYNTYVEYKDRIDVFYVAFSGGKDSVTVLDLVQRALPHGEFKVLFGDTGMEFEDTYIVVNKISEICKNTGIEFHRAKSKLSTEQTWNTFGPPSVTNRWCCSVHKTSPQIMLLQQLTDIQGFTGMAFTGVRGDESIARSEYEDVTMGGKHQGQFSCHPILEWNSAELYIYIYQNGLVLNEAYKKGNSRAGCLMCPMSSGKHEYMKRQCYEDGVELFVEKIKKTSGNTHFSNEEMVKFIDDGNWKTRKSGRVLGFGYDKHQINISNRITEILVFDENYRWKEWAKTIGNFCQIDENHYTVDYKEKVYPIVKEENEKGTLFTFPSCNGSKDDTKFISLFRSAIIKSIYCVNCGVCVAECKHGCIDMSNGLKISSDCKHCHKCHEIHEHCLRYNSIRNKIGAENKMKGLDRYFSFGIRKNWLASFLKYDGKENFWNTDGDGEVPNKKKDAFLNFVKDAGLVVYNKNNVGDKYSKYEPSDLISILNKFGFDSEITWAIMLCNLVYTSEFNWYIKNIGQYETVTPDQLKFMLEEVMENDAKGLGKRNITDAFKILLIKTPLGKEIGLGSCDFDEKISATGNETITLKSITRGKWENPDSLVILYSLYKFAEACEGYYQFTLSRLLNHDIDSEGVSPSQIFGLSKETMEQLLNGLAIKYPEFISASFTLDLDNINLRSDKKAVDILELF